jgi:hypothetical protein
MGNEITLTLSEEGIVISHNNPSSNVVTYIRVRSRDILEYEYNWKRDKSVSFSLSPSNCSTSIPAKKGEHLEAYMDSRSNYVIIQTLATNPNEQGHVANVPYVISAPFNHETPNYESEPNIKTTAAKLQSVLNNFSKSANLILVRPYTRGLEFVLVGQDFKIENTYKVGMVGDRNDSYLHFAAPLSGSQTCTYVEQEEYSSITDTVAYYDHIPIRYEDIVNLVQMCKITDKPAVIKIFYPENRKAAIKFEGPYGSDSFWEVFISQSEN